jgi:hypothetical protein
MLIPFGILSAAGAGGAVTGTYELISTTILGTATASVTFSNLGDYSTTYKHLQVRTLARTSHTSTDYLDMRLNGATSFWEHGLEANGSSVSSYNSAGLATSMAVALVANSTSTTNSFGGAVIDLLDPYSTTKNKTIRGLGGFGGVNIALRSGSWASTSSVTSITLLPSSGANLVSGSRFSLYGIRG